MNMFGQIIITLAKANASTFIKVGFPCLAFGCVSIYGIKTLADHDAMEHGYEREIKVGNIETKLKKKSEELDYIDYGSKR